MLQKWYVLSRNHTLNLVFWSFPGLVIYSIILSRDAGQQQWATAPSQPRDQESQSPTGQSSIKCIFNL